MKFLDNVGDPSYFPAPLTDCLCHVSFRKYSPLSVEVVENRINVKVSWSHFSWGWPQLFYSRLLARFTIRRLANFGWVPFADLRLRSLAMKQDAEFMEVGKMQVEFKAFVDQSSWRFGMMYENSCSCQRTWPIVYIMFRSEDIGR